MKRAALLALALLLAACDAPPLTPAWPDAPPRALMAPATAAPTGTPLPPGDAAAGARQTLAAIGEQAQGATARAGATDAAQMRALEGTYAALAVMRAQDASTATRVALEAAYAGTARAQDAAALGALRDAAASATAAPYTATAQAAAAQRDGAAAETARIATALQQLGLGAGVMVLCAGVPILVLTAAFAALAMWRQRGDVIELAGGEALRRRAGVWERVPEDEPEPDDEAPPPAPAVPPKYANWMEARVNGRVVAAYPPLEPAADIEDRRLALRLLTDAIAVAGPDSAVLPGWRKLPGWSPETWTKARHLLEPYLDARPGKGTLLRTHADLYVLKVDVEAGLHLATTPAPRTASAPPRAGAAGSAITGAAA